MLVRRRRCGYITNMFEVLVYLYETYYRPDACPDSVALAKKLSAVGFEEEESSRALGWLTDLAETTNEIFSQQARQTAFSFGFRVYAEREYELLGSAAIGFVEFLESADVINALQREIVLEPSSSLQYLLRVRLILPEVGAPGLGLDFAQFALQAGFVKVPSEGQRHGRTGLQMCG